MASKKKKKDGNQIFCTDSNCVATFSTENELDNHLIRQKHQYLSDQEDIPSTADKIKVMFSQKLRECRLNFNEGRPSPSEQLSSSSQSVPAGNQLSGFNTKATKHRFEDGNHVGWALRKR